MQPRTEAVADVDGAPVWDIELESPRLRVRVLSFGATVQSVWTPDRSGRWADVLLGYDAARDYIAHPRYLGVTVGRCANRIAHARFVLDGHGCQLEANDAPHSLHGGAHGFDRRPWRLIDCSGGVSPAVTLGLTSPDGDGGYPGRLEVTARMQLAAPDTLEIAYEATTDRPTVVNLTNHALFDLAGEGSDLGVLEHRLSIAASRYLPVDPGLIPTGELRAVAGSPFDFRAARPLHAGLRNGTETQLQRGCGFDHNFVLDKGCTPDPEPVARLEEPRSGRVLELASTEPGLQLYTGNRFDGSLQGKRSHLYRMSDGVALESQRFPDAPNQPAFPSVRLDPGETYRHRMTWRFFTAS